jgi:asparaginyl-tRNA synthetase
VEKGLIDRLKNVIDSEKFIRLTYTEAVEIITQPEVLKVAKFEHVPSWGDDLGSEHERYLTEKIFKQPVILTNYPAGIKAFYMRSDPGCAPGRQTVSAMDVLVPKIGELIGGSQREERLDMLESKIKVFPAID